MTEASPWPLHLAFNRAERMLRISFDNGSVFNLSAEYLRIESPSAEVQGHGSGQKKLVTGKRQVSISAMEPVGQYAVRIVFDDGHDTGLYSWSYLHQLGQEQSARWSAYEARLDASQSSRDA